MEFQPFDFDSYSEFTAILLKGEKMVNVHATALVYKVVLKLVTNLDTSLADLFKTKEIPRTSYKVFVIALSKLDIAEYIIYSALEVADNSVFF